MAKLLKISSLFLLLTAVVICAVIWLHPVAKLPEPPKNVIDMHVHVAGLGYGGSGCFVHGSLSTGWKSFFYLKALGVSRDELREQGDQLVVKRLSQSIYESKIVSKAVVLALDGVVKPDGTFNSQQTQAYVPNRFVATETAKYENLLFGASVHPYRKDALKRLDLWAGRGAVLVKWIPCIMGIDPADERIIPYYDKLAELDMPLLSHAGQEKAFSFSDNRLCDPRRLELALSRGVTVIAAHLSTTGEIDGKDYYEWLLPMFAKYTNLYADISSLTQLNKRGYLADALQQSRIKQRFVYGSDWPLQSFPVVSPWYQIDIVDSGKLKAVSLIDNIWDRDVRLKQVIGVPEAVFSRVEGLLRRHNTAN